MEQSFVNKRNINLDLSNIEHASKILKALSSETRLGILRCLVDKPMTISQLAEMFYLPMSSACLHIKILQEAGLITVLPKPGAHGMKKFCGITAANIVLDFFAHRNKVIHKPPVLVDMPVGCYCNCEVVPPCGIVTANTYLSEEDFPYGFYSPEHFNASLIWMTSGFLEYTFPNEYLLRDTVDYIEFSFEICSEAPGYNNDWPSDISLELNHKHVATMHLLGDYGGRRGIYNPSWWNDSSTQYGEFKHVYIKHDGCYLDEQKVSDETIESLSLMDGYSFSFLLRVDSSNQNAGGMNLFGKYFGDYAQDIVMRIEYKNDD